MMLLPQFDRASVIPPITCGSPVLSGTAHPLKVVSHSPLPQDDHHAVIRYLSSSRYSMEDSWHIV